MFARTERLTLRPGWTEDAPALAEAIGHWDVCSKLSRVPWPYTEEDARAWLAAQRDTEWPTLYIFEHEDGRVRLVGGIGISEQKPDRHELGYWLTPSAWGRGIATEAGRAVVRMARDSLRLKRLVSGHYLDNPASGRVLQKLGFRRIGQEFRHSTARGEAAACATLALDLCGEGQDDGDARPLMAA